MAFHKKFWLGLQQRILREHHTAYCEKTFLSAFRGRLLQRILKWRPHSKFCGGLSQRILRGSPTMHFKKTSNILGLIWFFVYLKKCRSWNPFWDGDSEAFSNSQSPTPKLRQWKWLLTNLHVNAFSVAMSRLHLGPPPEKFGKHNSENRSVYNETTEWEPFSSRGKVSRVERWQLLVGSWERLSNQFGVQVVHL